MVVGPKDAYLILYNAACCAGWAVVWMNGIASLMAAAPDGGSGPSSLSSVYEKCNPDLLYATQMFAVMEIVHAMLELVRSPVVVTAMQVMSRVVAVVAVRYSQDAQSRFSICGDHLVLLAASLVPRSFCPHFLLSSLSQVSGEQV